MDSRLAADALPRPLGYRHLAIFLIPLILAVIEIYYSAASWNFFYGLLTGPLDFLTSWLSTMEYFVGNATIASSVILLWIYRPEVRRTIVPFLVALLLLSVIVAGVKNASGRARPGYGLLMGKDASREVAEYLATKNNPVLKPEVGDYWLWFSPDRPGLEILGWVRGTVPIGERNRVLSIGDYASFPSGHAASAFGLAAWLALVMPRAKVLWYLLAFGCAWARVRSRRHHPGDVIVGGAIGWMAFQIVISWNWPLRLGERVERLVASILGDKDAEPRPAGKALQTE